MDLVNGPVPGAIDTDPLTTCVAFDTTQITSKSNYSVPKPGDPCHPLAAGAHAPAIAIQERAVSENPDAGPDGIGVRDDGAAYTLEARTVTQAVAYDMRGREGGAQFEGPHDTANIRAASGGSSKSYVAQAVAFHENQRGEVTVNDTAGSLKVGGGKPGQGYPAVAYGGQNASTSKSNVKSILRALRKTVGEEAFAKWRSGILDPLQSPEVLRSWLHGGSLRRPSGQGGPKLDDSSLACAKSVPSGGLRELWFDGPDGRSPQGRELAQQLAEQSGTALSVLSHQAASWAVRRLTPIECERLMGFPDGYTNVPWRGKNGAPDGPRYKALGNSMAVNCMRWIGTADRTGGCTMKTGAPRTARMIERLQETCSRIHGSCPYKGIAAAMTKEFGTEFTKNSPDS